MDQANKLSNMFRLQPRWMVVNVCFCSWSDDHHHKNILISWIHLDNMWHSSLNMLMTVTWGDLIHSKPSNDKFVPFSTKYSIFSELESIICEISPKRYTLVVFVHLPKQQSPQWQLHKFLNGSKYTKYDIKCHLLFGVTHSFFFFFY